CENRIPDLVAELHSDSSLMRESSEQTGGECTQSRWVTSLSQFGATTYGSTSRSICSRVEAVKKNVRNSSGVVGGAGVKTPSHIDALIGIGAAGTHRPCHTTVRTGPYTA